VSVESSCNDMIVSEHVAAEHVAVDTSIQQADNDHARAIGLSFARA